MKKTFNIIAGFLELATFGAVIYFSIFGIANAYLHGSWNIFSTIMLFVALISIILICINLRFYLQNKEPKKILKLINILISFGVGFVYVWISIVSANDNLLNALLGAPIMLSSILKIIFF